MQTRILLSIKPVFAEKIFLGIKRYEFRRKIFKDRTIRKIVVYASAPVSKVIGEFLIEEILVLEKEQLWLETRCYSGVPKEYFDKYFFRSDIGYAIKIRSPRLYTKPLELKEHFNVRHPPQSFMYL